MMQKLLSNVMGEIYIMRRNDICKERQERKKAIVTDTRCMLHDTTY